MSELLDLFVGDEVGASDKAAQVPSDLDNRDNFRRQILPEFLKAQTVEQIVTAPDASTQAVLDAATAETHDMSALEALELVVDDYVGRNQAAGTPGATVSGSGPELVSTNASADQLGVAINGEAAQQVDIGTQAGGAAIAAALQAGIRALTAATAANQEAYDSCLVEYSDPSFSSSLASALASGVQIFELPLVEVAGLNRGDVLEVTDSAGGPAAPFEITVKDIFRARKAIAIAPLTPGEIIEAGSLVRKRDDSYTATVGKRGFESTMLFSTGLANDVAADLKLTPAAGAATGFGTDAIGRQKIPFVIGDFADPAVATAAEMAVAINKALTGAIASDNAGNVRLTGRKFGQSANLVALVGVTQALLGLPLVVEYGTQDDIILDLRDADVLQIQAVSNAGVPGNYKADLSIVRVERDKLVNVDGTDHTGDEQWRVVLSPSSPA